METTDLVEAVRRRLEPGERMLWQGKPHRRRFALRGSPFVLVFSIVWLAFAVFWLSMAIIGGAPGFFLLWGAMFVAFGLYVAFGRFLVAAREADRTIYTLTDRRVVFAGGAWRPRYQELSLQTLPAPTLDEGADGVGTITFGTSMPYASMLGPGWPGMAGRARNSP